MRIPHPRAIRGARLEIGLLQAEAAEIAGVSEPEWRSWEVDPALESYEVIYGAAWERLLIETDSLRPEDSGFIVTRLRPPPYRPY